MPDRRPDVLRLTDLTGHPVYVTPGAIARMTRVRSHASRKGDQDCTQVSLVGDRYHYVEVLETPEEIVALAGWTVAGRDAGGAPVQSLGGLQREPYADAPEVG